MKTIAILILACNSHAIAQSSVRTGDLISAELAYERELKSRPTAETWQRLGLVRHLQNKFDTAIPAFQEAVRLDASLWTSHLFLGICLYRTNQFAAALASLNKADRLAPRQNAGRDDIDFWLGASQIALKRPLDGLQSLERLLARSPKHVEALELTVRTYADLSTSSWNEVAEKHFETAPGYEVHGYALEADGNREGAIEAFRISQSLAPKRAGPGLAIGRLLLLQGKPVDALAVLKSELNLAGAHPEAFYQAGLATVQTGQYRDAATYLQEAARWPARNPEAPLALAQVYLATKESTKAIAAARQAVIIDPLSLAAHEVLTATLAEAGLTQERAAEDLRWQNRHQK